MLVSSPHCESDLIEMVQHMGTAPPSKAKQRLAIADGNESFTVDGGGHPLLDLVNGLDRQKTAVIQAHDSVPREKVIQLALDIRFPE